jgi:hypothetical protein
MYRINNKYLIIYIMTRALMLPVNADAAELAEVLCCMPHLAALAVEGCELDARGDWLADVAGLLRHGR